ncbi:MAG: hypothetical protein QM500_12270 [Methylococcales bacterium]
MNNEKFLKNYNESVDLMDQAYALPEDSEQREDLEYEAALIVETVLTLAELIQDKNPYDKTQYPMLHRQYNKGLADSMIEVLSITPKL